MNKDDYIFGTRSIMEAISKGKQIEKVLIKKGLRNELFHELFSQIKTKNIFYQFVPIEKINKITRKNHQGVLAFVSPIEFSDIEMIVPEIFEAGKIPLILALDKVTDVRNFGAMVRSAECAGVQAIVLPQKGVARIGADAIKTSAGAIHHVPICRTKSLVETIRFLKLSGITIIAATEKADSLFTEIDLTVPACIVMGSEEKGISAKVLQLADQEVKIPILGKIESLNVSVAAALMVYEAIRQRN